MKRYILFALLLTIVAMQSTNAQEGQALEQGKSKPGHFICDRTYGFEAGVMASDGKDIPLLLSLALDWDTMPAGPQKDAEAAFFHKHLGFHPGDMDLTQLSQHAVWQAICAADERKWHDESGKLSGALKRLQAVFNKLRAEEAQIKADKEALGEALKVFSNSKKGLFEVITQLRVAKNTGAWRAHLDTFKEQYQNYTSALENLQDQASNLGLAVGLSNDLIDTSIKFETDIEEIAKDLETQAEART